MQLTRLEVNSPAKRGGDEQLAVEFNARGRGILGTRTPPGGFWGARTGRVTVRGCPLVEPSPGRGGL
jgi:hypothetical protein